MTTLFDTHPITKPFSYDELAVSCSMNETDILRWIIHLHNGGREFDVDCTYSLGHIWTDLPQPKYKFDLAPAKNGVMQGDARDLPLRAESILSILFDPPFLIKNVANRTLTGKTEKRFSAYRTPEELWKFYRQSLEEFYRILKKKGIAAVKCQDVISGRQQYWSHFEIMKYAERIGFTCADLFILVRKGLMWAPNMQNQQHARKNHCYYLVFVK